MSKIKILIELDKEIYKDVKESVYNVDSNYIEIGHAIGDGKVLPKTRKEVHKMLFGIDPPELGSPYCSCADGGDGCEFCRHSKDQNCDVQWWNAEMSMSAANQAADVESEGKVMDIEDAKEVLITELLAHTDISRYGHTAAKVVLENLVELVNQHKTTAYFGPNSTPMPEREFVRLESCGINGSVYYHIIYRENGEEHVGFSSFDLNVISAYLRDYFFSNEGDKHKYEVEEKK